MQQTLGRHHIVEQKASPSLVSQLCISCAAGPRRSWRALRALHPHAGRKQRGSCCVFHQLDILLDLDVQATCHGALRPASCHLQGDSVAAV
jgi:hypothetical protein